MQDSKPVNEKREPHVEWIRGHYVNDELLGYFEDLGPLNKVIEREYYAR